MNITDYLLLPEQAKWAKEKGFDGECDYRYSEGRNFRGGQPLYNHDHPYFKNKMEYDWCTAPTFDQFFDWVEEKWIIKGAVNLQQPGLYTATVKAWVDNGFPCWEPILKHDTQNFKTKRDARIAACEAIIKHINENEL